MAAIDIMRFILYVYLSEIILNHDLFPCIQLEFLAFKIECIFNFLILGHLPLQTIPFQKFHMFQHATLVKKHLGIGI